jgi:hypothetical protein
VRGRREGGIFPGITALTLILALLQIDIEEFMFM